MSRLIIRWTDPHERPHDWPFVSNGRKVENVEVDGEVYVPSSKVMKLAHANGELCAEVNELQARIAELEAGRTCELVHVKNGPRYDVWQFSCCGYTFAESVSEVACNFNYCPNCGCKVVDA